jgi:outer membrane protein assembly factor BamB
MKQKTLALSLLLITLALLTSGCGAQPALSWPGVTVDGNTAYVAYNEYVYAIDVASGTSRWQFPQEKPTANSFFAAPTLTSDGQLIVSGYNKTLYSLSPETGAQNWAFPDSPYRYVASPLEANGTIFAPTSGSLVYALDTNGKVLWPSDTGADGGQWAKPVNNESCTCIFVPSMDHHIYSIDAVTGEQKWKSEDLGGSVVGTPAWDENGTLYVGTFASEMLSINAENSAINWRMKTDGMVWGGPALLDGRLYFGDLKGSFYAVNTSDGSVVWRIQPDGPIAETPLIKDDTIYFSTEAGSVYAVDLNGNTKANWPVEIGGKLYSAPREAGDLILVAPNNVPQILVALDTGGSIRWKFPPEEDN